MARVVVVVSSRGNRRAARLRRTVPAHGTLGGRKCDSHRSRMPEQKRVATCHRKQRQLSAVTFLQRRESERIVGIGMICLNPLHARNDVEKNVSYVSRRASLNDRGQ